MDSSEQDERARAARRWDRRGFLRLAAGVAPAAAFTLACVPPSRDPRSRGTRGSAQVSAQDSPQGKEPGLGRAEIAPLRPPDRAYLEALAAERPRAPSADGTVVDEATAPMLYRNPVVAENCPDPHVMADGDTFYMVSTSHVLPAFPIRVSKDLVTWRNTAAWVFTRANRPDWAIDHFWAPELHRVDETYVCYYTARSRRTGRLCIGAAVAHTPFGPYRDLGRPLIDTVVSALDPTFFQDEDGRRYLYWKEDAGPGDPGGPICVRELTPDGLGFAGDRWEIARNDVDWEGPLIEGPSVIKRGGAYYLFYSGGAYDTPWYAVGVARSLSPTGGFSKHGDPILRGSDRWRGPGHNSIVHHGDWDYIVYHAWEGEHFRNVRPGLIDRVDWRTDGWPGVGDGTPRESGEL